MPFKNGVSDDRGYHYWEVTLHRATARSEPSLCGWYIFKTAQCKAKNLMHQSSCVLCKVLIRLLFFILVHRERNSSNICWYRRDVPLWVSGRTGKSPGGWCGWQQSEDFLCGLWKHWGYWSVSPVASSWGDCPSSPTGEFCMLLRFSSSFIGEFWHVAEISFFLYWWALQFAEISIFLYWWVLHAADISIFLYWWALHAADISIFLYWWVLHAAKQISIFIG